MNKITITKEKQLDLKDNAVDIDVNVPELTINVKGKVLINEISKKDNENMNLTINVEPQSSLVYNRFLIHNIMNNKITINQDHKSEVVFNYSFIANDKCHLTIDTNVNGNDNETEVNIKTVTENDGNAVDCYEINDVVSDELDVKSIKSVTH